MKYPARKKTNEFGETEEEGRDLEYRLPGKDSRLFCHKFIRLIKFLSCEGNSRKQRQTGLVYACVGINLRDCVSLFNRLQMNKFKNFPKSHRNISGLMPCWYIAPGKYPKLR